MPPSEADIVAEDEMGELYSRLSLEPEETPDDLMDSKDGPAGRARQNVLFELGYFVGKFGRRSGRVILLAKEGVEIPSDLSGVIHIDITEGVSAAGERIRLELEALE